MRTQRTAPLDGPAGLGSARAQIDALDDALLDLIERRLAASAAVAASKDAERDDHLWLRPRREAAIIARLCDRAISASPTLIERVWRELMAWSLQAQRPIELVVGSANPVGLAPSLRRRFGSAAPLRSAAGTAEALEAARTGQAIAILGCEGLQEPLPAGLMVFDRISDESGAFVAVAIGRIVPDELGDAGGREAAR